MPDHGSKPRRRTRSLAVLTKRFLGLLQESEGGVLDLKDAVKVLALEQKRRLYDITNVLEGVGLIDKISKCCVKWKGSPAPGQFGKAFTNRVKELTSELQDLEQKEIFLDLQKFWIEQSIRNTTEDCRNLTYVNHEDICNCFCGRTVFAVRVPAGTQLEVPIPKAVHNRPPKYQVYLKSTSGPIDVLLLNKRSVSSSPLALPVPPPEDILRSAKLAVSTSGEAESSVPPPQASADADPNTRLGQTATEDTWSPSLIKTEPNITEASELRKELEDILRPTKELMKEDVIKRLLASDVFSPLLRLPPPPPKQEYMCNLDQSEGLCDLFDIPVFNV